MRGKVKSLGIHQGATVLPANIILSIRKRLGCTYEAHYSKVPQEYKQKTQHLRQ